MKRPTLLLRPGAVSFLIKIASVGVGLVSAIIMVRMMGAGAYGEYSYIFALVTLVAIPAQLGLPNLVVRETARAKQARKMGQILHVWKWAHQVVVLISLACVLILGAGAFFLQSTGIRPETLFWALPLIPLIALGNIRGAALRGLGRVNLGQLPEMLLRPVLFVLALFAGWLGFGNGKVDATMAMQLQSLSALIAFAIGGFWLLGNRPEVGVIEPISSDQNRIWLKSSVILGLVAGLQTLNGNADVVLMGMMRSNAEVGIYKIAGTIGAMSSFVLASLSVVVMPKVVALLHSEDKAALQHLVRRTAQMSFAAALACILVLAVAGQTLLVLCFGPEFVASYPAMLILVLGHMICAFFGPLTLLLNMAGLEREAFIGVGIGALVNIGASLLLIPMFGGTGAAVATTASFAVWNVLLYLRARKKLGIDCAAFPLLRISRKT